MIDAYTHLDVTAPDPIADYESLMAMADVGRAVVVETWNGETYALLDTLIKSQSPKFRVVPCFRPVQGIPSLDLLEHSMVAGLRSKTGDLLRLGSWASRLESLGKWLVPHAEQGVGPLAEELVILQSRFPALRIYVPHCAWPRKNKVDDPEWEEAITRLSTLPNIVAGVSAIAEFSTEPFPHNDIKPFVERLREKFGPQSVVAGSDYPLLEKTLYKEYIKLAQQWIQQGDTNWSASFESPIFKS